MADTPGSVSVELDTKDPVERGKASGWLTAAKLLLAVGIVAGLFYYDVIDARALLAVVSDPARSVPCGTMILAAVVLGGVRWFLILRTFGVSLPFRGVVEIYGIGMFFNAFLPGATGGDVMRLIYVVRSVEKGKLRAAVSIFADRVIGLYGLLVLSMVLIALSADSVFAHGPTRVFGVALVGFFAAITGGGVVLLLIAQALQATAWARSWEGRGGWRRVARMSMELVLIFRNALPTLAATIALSAVMNGLVVGSIVWLGWTYEGMALGTAETATAAALASLAGAVPLTPGGIGIAEGAFAYICALWAADGSVAYGTIFLGNRLLVLAVSLLGAIGFITHKRIRGHG